MLVALWSPKYTVPMKILFLYLSHCEKKGNCCWNYYHLCSSFEGVSQSQEIRNLCILIEPSACLKYKAAWTLRDICHSCFFSPAAVPLSVAFSRFALNSRCRTVHTGCFSSGVQGAKANFTLCLPVLSESAWHSGVRGSLGSLSHSTWLSSDWVCSEFHCWTRLSTQC